MAPRTDDSLTGRKETSGLEDERERDETIKSPHLPIVWRNVALFTFLHLGALYGLYRCFYSQTNTLLFAFVLYVMGGLGITAGAHRLWAHRTYKARMPLRVLLAVFQTLAVQNSIFEWCRDHRAHHKHSETDADPHNAKRGLFFSHMGWLMIKKHPDVMTKGSKIPLDDLLQDPVVSFQKKYYKPLAILTCFIMPTVVPMLAWNESFINAYFVPGLFRYVFTLHMTWLVNSVAHRWGHKKYDKSINPVENLLVSLGAIGEGFHNYHHTFPQDYATSEYGWVYFNLTKLFIDTAALFGLAYDRKKISPQQVLSRRGRTGDLCPVQEEVVEQLVSSSSNHEHEY